MHAVHWAGLALIALAVMASSPLASADLAPLDPDVGPPATAARRSAARGNLESDLVQVEGVLELVPLPSVCMLSHRLQDSYWLLCDDLCMAELEDQWVCVRGPRRDDVEGCPAIQVHGIWADECPAIHVPLVFGPPERPTATRSPTATDTPTATPTPAYTPTATRTPTATSTPVQEIDCRISALEHAGSDEYVEIRNYAASVQGMSGWKIHSVQGDQWFEFPFGYSLAPGGVVRVHSGPEAINDPPDDLWWTGAYVWNDSGDEARLVDDRGRVVDVWSY